MQNYQTPRPILKPKTKIVGVLARPQPPTQSRPEIVREQKTLTDPAVREQKTLKNAIDYESLTPTKQAQWDAGLFGHIEQKTIKGNLYYYLRWRDPQTNKLKSTYLAKKWDKAIAKMQKLTA
jgi:hypothetical protein